MNRILIALLLAACGDKSEEAPPASGSAPAGSSGPAGSAKPAAGSAVAAGSASAGSGSAAGSAAVAKKEPEIPTPEDFEAEATTRITEKNLDTEVKLIEKEIGEE